MGETLRAGGMRWQLAPGVPGEQLFGPEGFRLPEWRASGLAVLVKERPRRSIWRVQLPGLDFYLKNDHPPGASRLRRLLRAGATRSEYERGLAVAERGVPTPQPLAFAESLGGPPSGFLLTRTVLGSVPLDVFLVTILPTLPPDRRSRLRQRVAVALGRLLARMHDAGVTHRDLHPGNLLLQADSSDEPSLWLIDLHAVHLGRSLGVSEARANLVVLNRWFALRSERSDRLRCWQAYQEVRRSTGTPPLDRAAASSECRQLERATLRSNVRFWRVRDRRCLGSNRYFRRVRQGAVAGHAVADLPADALAPFLAEPDAAFGATGVRILKDSPSSTVAELELAGPDGPRKVIYKRFAVTKWTDPWAALARPTAALHSWVMGHGLLTRLLPTPRPLAVLHRYRRGLPREGYLLTEKVPDAVDLAACVDRLAGRLAEERRLLLREMLGRVGRLLRTLHQRHLSHRDLKAPNLLLQTRNGEWGMGNENQEVAPSFPIPHSPFRIFFIDLLGVRRHGKLRRSRRVQNLARLHASFRSHPALTRTDKLRFLRAYLAWGLHGRLGWKRWWRQVEAATEAKVLRNRRNGRPLN